MALGDFGGDVGGERHFREKYGVAVALPPDSKRGLWVDSASKCDSWAPALQFSPAEFGEAIMRTTGDPFRDVRLLFRRMAPLLSPTEIGIAFDLARPLREQLEMAAESFKQHQRVFVRNGWPSASPKNHIRHYPTYLRLLDAEAAGATQREMGQVLFSKLADPTKRAKDALKAAKAMRDGVLVRRPDGTQFRGVPGFWYIRHSRPK